MSAKVPNQNKKSQVQSHFRVRMAAARASPRHATIVMDELEEGDFTLEVVQALPEDEGVVLTELQVIW